MILMLKSQELKLSSNTKRILFLLPSLPMCYRMSTNYSIRAELINWNYFTSLTGMFWPIIYYSSIYLSRYVVLLLRLYRNLTTQEQRGGYRIYVVFPGRWRSWCPNYGTLWILGECYDTEDPCVTQPYVVRHIYMVRWLCFGMVLYIRSTVCYDMRYRRESGKTDTLYGTSTQ